MHHVWIHTLTLPFLLWARLRHGAAVTLHAGRVCPRAERLLAWAARYVRMPKVVRHDIQLGMVDEHGACLSGRLEMRLLALADALPLGEGGWDWLPVEDRAHADSWSRILRAHYVSYNREPLIPALFAENAHRTGAVPLGQGDRVSCYVVPPMLGRWTASRLPVELPVPVKVRFWPTPYQIASCIRFLPERPHYWLSRLRRRATPAAALASEAVRAGTILQQNTPGIFDLYPANGHLYWLDGSGVPPERVVIHCDREDSPAGPLLRQSAAALGVGWIDAAPLSDHLDDPVRDALDTIWRCRSALPRRLSAVQLWRWANFTRFAVVTRAYRALVRRTNAKLGYQSWVWVPNALSFALALRMEGGAFLWNFWSIHALPVAQHHYGIGDLVLCWGPYHQGFYKAHRLDYRVMLMVGTIMGDGRQDGDDERAAGYRAALGPDTRFVLTLLDTSYGAEAHNTQGHLIEFYRSVLGLMARHPDWGCIIKSKGQYASLPPTPGIQDVVERLVADGRCVIPSTNERVSVVSLAGDMAVCASTNSAGFLAALVGKHAVHLDIGGLVTHPVAMSGGDGRVVFRTVLDFEAAIEAAAAGAPEIGDHGPWLDLLDGFRDGQGRFRAGAAIRTYLDGVARGLDRDAALAEVARAHARAWGPASVDLADSPAEGLGDALWRQSRTRVIDSLPEPPARRPSTEIKRP